MSTSRAEAPPAGGRPTEDEMQFFFDLSLDLLCIANLEGRFIRLNPAWEHALGWSREELMAVPYVSFIHPDDVAATSSEADSLSQGALTLTFENRYRRKDGDYIWLRWHAKPNLERGVIYASAQDVTQEKAIEARLLETSRMQRAILDGTDFSIISTDAQGIIRTFNAAAQRSLGYTPEEVIGSITPIIFHDTNEIDHHAETVSRELGRPVEPGLAAFVAKAAAGLPDEQEWTYIRKDGSTFPGLASVTALRDEEGSITGFVGVSRDITERKESEEALRGSQERLRLALESAQIGDWELNLVTKAARRSLRHDQIFGYDELQPEWTYEIFRDHVHPDDRTRVDQSFQESVAAGHDWYFECRIIRADKSLRWIWARGSVFKNAAGVPTNMLGMVGDITERKALEQNLVETTRLQRAILDGANFTIISGSTEGIIRTFNAAAERDLGYQAEEVIGKVTPAIFHDPEEVAQRAAELTAELGIPVEPGFEAFVAKARLGSVDEHEWTYIRKDGSRFPVLLSITALRDEAGTITGFLGVGSDITEKKRAEAARREAEARLQGVLDNTTAVIFIKDLEGRYILVNKRWGDLFHVTPGEVIGLTDQDIFPPEMARAFRENDLAVQQADGPMVLEEIAPHDDGPHTYLSVKFPLRDAAGQPNALGGIATDITDRKHTEEDLRRSNEALEQFAYVASHDLQEPLRIVVNYLQLLERRYKPQLNEEATLFIDTAVNSANRMRTLIRDLLEFSRLGRRARPLAPVDSGAMLDTVLANMQVTIEETGTVIEREGKMPRVIADDTQIGRVFQNLIGNAIRFRGDKPPKIHIGAQRYQGVWRFHVRDEGLGIDPRFFGRIFEIFRRLDAKDDGGTGMGLAICKRIIEGHGGQIWVESAPGEGSTFYFTLKPSPHVKKT